MGMLGSLLLSVGFFVSLVGVILVTNSPFMREILEQVEFLQKNRRILGIVMAVVGFALMVFSFSA